MTKQKLILDYGFGYGGLGGRTYFEGKLIRFEPDNGKEKYKSTNKKIK